jgi:ABC-2 type transport system ATP-binding protein
LAEIESFSSHVGFLDSGKLLFSEEMSVLSERFREVTVTLAQPSPLPANLPASWLQPQSADCMLRFVHNRYEELATAREIYALIPTARDISFDAMPLRSIFLAIAKANRGAAQANSAAAQEAHA